MITPEEKKHIFRLAEGNMAQFCYQYCWTLLKADQIQVLSNDGTFIFKLGSHVTTYGHLATIQTLLRKFPFDIGERVTIIFPSHHLPAIQSRFEDFALLDESETTSGNFSHIRCLSLDRSNFVPKRQAKTAKSIKPDLLEQLQFDPELIEYVKEGLAYGIIEDTELISIAIAPYIIKDMNQSFAVLHYVWTKEEFRNKGYGTGSLRSILNFLITRKTIKNIYTWTGNDKCFRMFEKAGFIQTGTEWTATLAFVKDVR